MSPATRLWEKAGKSCGKMRAAADKLDDAVRKLSTCCDRKQMSCSRREVNQIGGHGSAKQPWLELRCSFFHQNNERRRSPFMFWLKCDEQHSWTETQQQHRVMNERQQLTSHCENPQTSRFSQIREAGIFLFLLIIIGSMSSAKRDIQLFHIPAAGPHTPKTAWHTRLFRQCCC